MLISYNDIFFEMYAAISLASLQVMMDIQYVKFTSYRWIADFRYVLSLLIFVHN